MAKPQSAGLTTANLLELLRRHYIKAGSFPGGVFVHEIGGNGPIPGGGKIRRCDALYVGFTSTSGRLLVGHELKISRSDWLHELASPGKSDQWADQCHAWYVVAPSTDVVRPEELPAGWGLMIVVSGKVTRFVKAVEHLDRDPSWWAVRSLIARSDTLMEQTIERRVAASLDARVRERIAQQQRMDAIGVGRHEKLTRAIEQAIGDEVRYLDPDVIARTVADVLSDRRTATEARYALTQMAQNLRWAGEHIAATLTKIEAADDREEQTQ